MTKEHYIEMCEMLGQPVNEEELPYEIDDFPYEAQQALDIYHILQDNWDMMNGRYMGKNLLGLQDIFEIHGIEKEDRAYILKLIKLFDIKRAEVINKQTKPASES